MARPAGKLPRRLASCAAECGWNGALTACPVRACRAVCRARGGGGGRARCHVRCCGDAQLHCRCRPRHAASSAGALHMCVSLGVGGVAWLTSPMVASSTQPSRLPAAAWPLVPLRCPPRCFCACAKVTASCASPASTDCEPRMRAARRATQAVYELSPAAAANCLPPLPSPRSAPLPSPPPVPSLRRAAQQPAEGLQPSRLCPGCQKGGVHCAGALGRGCAEAF